MALTGVAHPPKCIKHKGRMVHNELEFYTGSVQFIPVDLESSLILVLKSPHFVKSLVLVCFSTVGLLVVPKFTKE